MFERYNIDSLFLASVNCDYNNGMLEYSYDYLTVLQKDNDKYIDLQDISRKITNVGESDNKSVRKSYTINYAEPLSKYYTQDGRKKVISKRKALIKAKKMNQEYQIQQAQEQKNNSFIGEII